MNIYIPSDLNHNVNKKQFFILVRPFYSDNGWVLDNKQLKKWGIKYHSLLFGKPVFDVYIDDKNFEFKKNWHKKFNKQILKNV